MNFGIKENIFEISSRFLQVHPTNIESIKTLNLILSQYSRDLSYQTPPVLIRAGATLNVPI